MQRGLTLAYAYKPFKHFIELYFTVIKNESCYLVDLCFLICRNRLLWSWEITRVNDLLQIDFEECDNLSWFIYRSLNPHLVAQSLCWASSIKLYELYELALLHEVVYLAHMFWTLSGWKLVSFIMSFSVFFFFKLSLWLQGTLSLSKVLAIIMNCQCKSLLK